MKTLCRDIAVQEGPDRLLFGNSRLKLEIRKAGGEWLALTAKGVPGNIIAYDQPTAAVDFCLDGEWMIQRHGAALVRYDTSVDRRRKAAALHLVLGVIPTAPQGPYQFELTCTYTLFAGRGRLERSARLLRNAGGKASASVCHMEGFAFRLPGVAVGDPAECTVDVPGPWFPNTYVAPVTPYERLKDQSLAFHSAPDGSFGLLAVSNNSRNMTLACWMDTGGETGEAGEG